MTGVSDRGPPALVKQICGQKQLRTETHSALDCLSQQSSLSLHASPDTVLEEEEEYEVVLEEEEEYEAVLEEEGEYEPVLEEEEYEAVLEEEEEYEVVLEEEEEYEAVLEEEEEYEVVLEEEEEYEAVLEEEEEYEAVLEEEEEYEAVLEEEEEYEQFLTLCEVQAFADLTDEQKASLLAEKTGLRNVALKGRATQSSLKVSFGITGNAIDGNRKSNLTMGSCTESVQESAPWWRVNLHRKYTVSTVALTNRGDCCPESLDGAKIRIRNSIENEGKDNPLCTFMFLITLFLWFSGCATASSIPAGQTEYFNCSALPEGSYVTVSLPREGTLSLCEVEVFGVPVYGPLRAWDGLFVQSWTNVTLVLMLIKFRGSPVRARLGLTLRVCFSL
ncbi:hypothetical protein AOLI_G00177120 [Acnodon oligacanthus]